MNKTLHCDVILFYKLVSAAQSTNNGIKIHYMKKHKLVIFHKNILWETLILIYNK